MFMRDLAANQLAYFLETFYKKNLNPQPLGGAKGKVSGSSKSVEFIQDISV